jgi:hypothetical protein
MKGDNGKMAAFARPIGSMPGHFNDALRGLTKREWFAGYILPAMIIQTKGRVSAQVLKQRAFTLADLMCEEGE